MRARQVPGRTCEHTRQGTFRAWHVPGRCLAVWCESSLTMHLQSGSIKDHMHQEHDSTLTRKELTANTNILKYYHHTTRLHIAESLLIIVKRPTLNNQTTGLDRVLTLFNHNTRTTPQPRNSEIIQVHNINTHTHEQINQGDNCPYNLRRQCLSNSQPDSESLDQ